VDNEDSSEKLVTMTALHLLGQNQQPQAKQIAQQRVIVLLEVVYLYVVVPLFDPITDAVTVSR
jgi:hypothetical protein